MDIKQKIGQRIKEIRTQLNLSQEAVANKAEIERTFMTHVENGRRNVSIETLEKIVTHGLEISFHEFFESDVFDEKKVKEVVK
jgi:transcriptional regulator with XRE-family HTH domain